MTESILVTGARGFTGHHFVALAKLQGYSVTALEANLLDRNAVALELQDASFDYVVHLAAISFVGHGNASEIYDVNVIGTQNLLDGIVRSGHCPKKLLIASSANIYGNSKLGVISEDVMPQPVNHYAISKLAMEHIVATYFDQLPVVLVRPFNYTGPGQDVRFVIPKIVEHFKRAEPVVELGNIEVVREYNDVRFVCDAYMKLLLGNTSADVFNVCTSKGYSLSDVISRLTEITGHALDVSVNPAFVRPNEIAKLLGDSSKLNSAVGELATYSLTDTLQSMLRGPK